MKLAAKERSELVQDFRAVGPDAPTLCGEWTTRDLAAHLVVRERRLDATPGIMIPALAGRLQRVQEEKARLDWDELIDEVAEGAPWYSPFRYFDSVMNATEFLVHHEDVRRAQAQWEPRELPSSTQGEVWRYVSGLGRMTLRSAPVGVNLQTPDGRSMQFGPKNDSQVRITGEPLELLLWLFGREQAQVSYAGDPEAVHSIKEFPRGM